MGKDKITMNEVWKPVAGYEGIYEVSSIGRVRSLSRPKEGKYSHKVEGRILAQGYNKANGYYSVNLCYKGKHRTSYVHRLVAGAFLPNPNGLEEVNHKDENKRNNRADNLEWCDRLYNIHHGTGMSRRLRSIAASKKGRCYPKRIAQYTLDGKLVATYYSSEEAARALNCNGSNIRTCARHERGVKQSNGFRWEYCDTQVPDSAS